MPHHLYHYTRLLPDEVIRIQTEGLKPLSEELLALKIQAANAYGANLQTTDIRPNQWSLRQGQICFIARDFQDIVECRYSDSGYSDIADLRGV